MIEDFDLSIDKVFLDQFTNDYLSGKILDSTKIDPETGLIPFNITDTTQQLTNLADCLTGNGNENTPGAKPFKAATGLIKVDSEKRIKYELLDGGHIKGSEDSVSKSLRAKFKFSIEKQTDTEIEKEVTLYGFDFK